MEIHQLIRCWCYDQQHLFILANDIYKCGEDFTMKVKEKKDDFNLKRIRTCEYS
jgi:hypothetical protein